MWTHEETARLRLLYDSGKTVDEIAAEIIKSRLDVTNKLISLGLKPKTERPAPKQASIFNEIEESGKKRKRRITITPEIEKRVCALRREGRNYDNIAELTGVSRSTIGRILEKNEFYHCKMHDKEPAPVAAGTSPDLKKSTENNSTKSDFVQEQLKKMKATLETADYSTMAKVGQVVGKAIGRIDTLICMMGNTEG